MFYTGLGAKTFEQVDFCREDDMTPPGSSVPHVHRDGRCMDNIGVTNSSFIYLLVLHITESR